MNRKTILKFLVFTMLVGMGTFVHASYFPFTQQWVDSDTLDGHDSTYFQREISSSSCATGIASVADDGTLTCANAQTDTDWVESGGDVYRLTGNVGIGTASPDAKLDVQSGNKFILLDVDSSGTDSLLQLHSNSVSNWARIGTDGSSLAFLTNGVNDPSNTAPALFLSNNQNVGIGDATPDGTLKLDVEGQVGATAYCDENGANCETITALAADTDTTIADGLTCSPTQILKWNGSAWACDTDLTGTDDQNLEILDPGSGDATIAINDGTNVTLVDGTNITLTPNATNDTITISSTDNDTQLSEEQVEDFVGSMLGGTETRISVTYDDAGNAINFVVDDMNDVVSTWADGDTLPTCPAGSHLYNNGGVLACSSTDLDTRVDDGLTCAADDILEWTGSAWACAQNVDLDNQGLTASTVAGGALLDIDNGTGVEYIGGGGTTVTRTDLDTITISSTDTDTQLSESTVEGYIANDVDTNYVPRDNGTKLVTGTIYDDGTSVGVGTANPDAPLEIFHVPAVNDTFDDVLKITSKYPTAAADGFGPAIAFSGSINDTQERLLGRIATSKEGTSNMAGMTFSTQTTADTVTEKMRILANGNVGIGTTSPGATLEVVSPSATDALLKVIAADYETEYDSRIYLGESDLYGMTFEYDGNTNIAGIRVGASGTTSSRRIQFDRTNNYTNFMAGNVGIGTLAPASLLSVHNSTGQGDIRLSTDVDVGSGNTTQMIFVSDADGVPATSSLGHFGSGDLRFSGVGNLVAPDMIIESATGSVGIGTTTLSGTLKLDVEGQVGATEYCDETGANCIDIANVGAGDVVGPASSTDNAIARFDSTTGKIIQNSTATIDDTGMLTLSGQGDSGSNSYGMVSDTAINLQHASGGSSSIYFKSGVNSPSDFGYIRFEDSYTGSGENALLTIGVENDQGTDDYVQIKSRLDVDSDGFSTDNANIQRWLAAGTERMRLTSAGALGIGDTSPDGTLKLDVEGQVGATGYCDASGTVCKTIAEMANSAETDPVFIAWDKSTGISITESQISDLDHYDSIEFLTDFNLRDTDDLTEGSTNRYFADTLAISAVGGEINDSGTTVTDLWSADKISTELATAGAWTVSGGDVYRSSGSVGIGDTTPDSMLDVEGDITADGVNAQSGQDLVLDGTTGTGNVIIIIGQ